MCSATAEGQGRALISVAELRRRYGLPRDMAYRAVEEGRIPSIAVGKRRFVVAAAADRVLGGTARTGEEPARAGNGR